MKNMDHIELPEETKIEFMLRFVCQVDLYTTFPYVKREHLELEIMQKSLKMQFKDPKPKEKLFKLLVDKANLVINRMDKTEKKRFMPKD